MKKMHLFIPIINYIIGIVLLFIGYQIMSEIKLYCLLSTIFVPLIPFFFPIYNYIKKKELPLYLNIMICIHIALSIYGGGIFNLYNKIFFYDLLLHAYFGFICSYIIYYFLVINKIMIEKNILIIILLSTLGVGTIWEFWEYFCDCVFDGDAQRVKEALSLGVSPIADTMEDLLITVVGYLAFLLSFLFKKEKKAQ
ncbi:MAG: hypothetical protein ACI35S_09350 [Anaeroplasma sp.]